MATFIWPTDVDRVTSNFRTSDRPHHNGTDFAEGGYHEIKAAAAGTVRRSYLSSSYGECIMIEHHIHGDVWETVYAHMRPGSRRVGDGDYVSQGDVIGVMGTTGDSTGQHLHFELHKNGNWNIDKTNAVDPRDYLGRDLYDSGSGTTYTVQSGDTLSEIGAKLGIDWRDIAAVNNIDEPYTIHPGQELDLPGSGNSGIPVVGHIEIINVANAAYICDRPSSTDSKNLDTAPLGSRWPIAGSIPGWFEIIYNGRRAYVNEDYGKRV